MNKRKKIVKGIISYILTLAMTIFFALYLNATVGWFMLVALILAPVLSVFFMLISSASVCVNCEMEDCILNKNDMCTMKVTIHNRFLFPTTPLEVQVLDSASVRSEDKHILVSVLPFEKQTIIIHFKAKMWGASHVGVKSVKATDYLGLFAFSTRKKDAPKWTSRVFVIPEIVDVSPRDDKILNVVQASCFGDDGDDTVEVSSYNTYGGFPGCDNREYVPGDSLKRINWKQSAKREKLLVRLDDVLASKSVNLVLDSAYFQKTLPIEKLKQSSLYQDMEKEEIEAKIAEDAVETTLGIVKALIASNYTVKVFFTIETEFTLYEIEDEQDIELLRIRLAEYDFDRTGEKERFPKEEMLEIQSSFIYCTPNDYKMVYSHVKEERDENKISVFSIVGDVVNALPEVEQVSSALNKGEKKKKRSQNVPKSIGLKKNLLSMMIPYCLALVSSVTLFEVFKVSPVSLWTVLQAIVCLAIFALCYYAKEHKFIGGAIIGIVIVGALFYFSTVAFSGITYMQWFVSGADTIESTSEYLLSLIAIFTLLFSMVLFYYTQIYYRTFAILLVSIIPYVVYVKLIREVRIGYVAIAVVLNAAAFLINTRKRKDAKKRIVGFTKGILSLGIYALCFIMMAFAVPRGEETKYYHYFEEWFLGGNASVPIPEEYGDQNDYSGNADNFNQLTNRQLYNIYNADLSDKLYVRRQVFDYYDFENDRWYDDDIYATYANIDEEAAAHTASLQNENLLKLLIVCDELSPGFLEKYQLEELKNKDYRDVVNHASISARNFESFYLIAPLKTLNMETYYSDNIHRTAHGVYGNGDAPFGRYISYDITYVSEFKAKKDWIAIGGANLSYEQSYQLYDEMLSIINNAISGEMESSNMIAKEELEQYKEWSQAFYQENRFAKEYANACQKNTEEIPDEIVALARNITKDCTYEWEKAEALEQYFENENFVYDLEYDAPDDSVEYFLFEGKTGTCSDFASAYVLMARAVGLTVRYVEGFVPSREISATYEWQYLVRTKSSHAYPEVYIPNLGFVVYEPTVGGIGEMNFSQNAGIMAYITTLVFRFVGIISVIVLLIAFGLLISRIIAPTLAEKHFMSQVKKAENNAAVIMLYKRFMNKYVKTFLHQVTAHTPYEVAMWFEQIFQEDISILCYAVEKSIYGEMTISTGEFEETLEIYYKAKSAVKEYKKQNKKR